MEDIISLYDKHFKNIKIDKTFVKELVNFRLRWSQKSDDYINFLSSNLTGVYPVRFSMIDEDNLYKVFKVNKKDLQRDSDKLRDIDPTRMVSSNVTYLSFIYLMHKFAVQADKKLAVEAIKELNFLFSVKALGSMFYRFFSHNLDVPTAKAAYEKLSNRFILKKEGNWQKVIDYRANDVLPNGSLYDKIVNLNTLEATKIVASIHGAYKSMLINIFRVIKEIIDTRGSISSSTIIENIEDGTAIKDDINSASLVISYLHTILPYPTDLIDGDLIHLVTTLSKNVSDKDIRDTMVYISNNSNDPKMREHLDIIIKISINYLRNKGISDPTNDIIKTLNSLKGYWSTGDNDIKKTKEYMKIACYKSTGKKTVWILGSIVIAVILYIYLRSIVKNKNN